MRIVIFIQWFSPAYKAGGPVQSILNLVNQPIPGYEYRVVCSHSDLDNIPLQGVQYDTWQRFNERTEVWYNSKGKNIVSVIRHLRNWRPDLYFINGIYSLPYNFLPLLFGEAPRKIISARGMLHAGALSQKGIKKRIYLALWRFIGLPRRNFFHATNAEEASFIKAAFGKFTKVFVAPNFPRFLSYDDTAPKQPGDLKLISIGLISPMKNYLQVLKALAGSKNKIVYTIYGPVKENDYWQQCKDQMQNLPSNVSVVYKGDLPSEEVGAALHNQHVFILPSKSENFGHAIYEALTAGKPVITSHGTPWNGLKEANAGLNISPENDYELSEAICFFAAADQTVLDQWSVAARDYAVRLIDVPAITEQYRAMFSNPN